MNKSYSSCARLISQSEICEVSESWHSVVFKNIKTRLGEDPDFPCVFSKNAFRKKLIKFIFVENVESDGIQHLAEGLKEYVEISKMWDHRLDTAYPLIAAFSLDAITTDSVEGYHKFGWQILQKLVEIDLAPWPEKVVTDPNMHSWSMCFNGMPLFCNMSSPMHHIRKSRNLGDHFILVINPRERFDIFASNTPNGQRVRENIRKRIANYDGVKHSLQLGSYGSGDIEWWQYGLIEENTIRTDKCPFKFLKSSNVENWS